MMVGGGGWDGVAVSVYSMRRDAGNGENAGTVEARCEEIGQAERCV